MCGGSAFDMGKWVAHDFFVETFDESALFESLQYRGGKTGGDQVAAGANGVREQVVQAGGLAWRAFFDFGNGVARGFLVG